MFTNPAQEVLLVLVSRRVDASFEAVLSALEILGIVAVVAFAAGVQSISGFGFALLSMPMMTLIVDPQVAVVVSTVVGLVSASYQAVRDRTAADVALAKRLTVASFCGMPFGLFVFITFSQDTLRVLLGTVIVIATLLLARGITLKDRVRHHEWIVGVISGVLATALSTNGPPLVILLQARRLEPDQFRATINRVFAVVGLGSFIFFVAAKKVTSDALLACLLALPVLFIALKLGLLARPYMQGKRFQRLVLVLLALSGISAITSAVL